MGTSILSEINYDCVIEGGSTREPWLAIDARARFAEREAVKQPKSCSKLQRKIILAVDEGLEIRLHSVLGKHPGSKRNRSGSKRTRRTQREVNQRAFAIKSAARVVKYFLRSAAKHPEIASRN